VIYKTPHMKLKIERMIFCWYY